MSCSSSKIIFLTYTIFSYMSSMLILDLIFCPIGWVGIVVSKALLEEGWEVSTMNSFPYKRGYVINNFACNSLFRFIFAKKARKKSSQINAALQLPLPLPTRIWRWLCFYIPTCAMRVDFVFFARRGL